MKLSLNAAKRNWFLFTLGSNVALAWVLLKCINILPDFIISAERKKEISFLLCCIFSKIIFNLNPHIKIKTLGGWDVLNGADTNPMVIIINHTSTLDAIFFAAMLPLKYASKIKTLFKADLLDTPILGDLFRYCGHFPVHFKHSEVGKFSVDQEKQTKVIEDIKQHLSNGGHLAFFPEGQINRGDSRTLQPFRNGLFKIFLEHQMQAQALASTTENNNAVKNIKMVAFLHRGLEKTWHPTATTGGNPSEVQCKVFPLLFSKDSQLNAIQDEAQENLDFISAQSVQNRNALSKL
jgi:1-acyl-sn-glycerol-3-phosphate acyltransferase